MKKDKWSHVDVELTEEDVIDGYDSANKGIIKYLTGFSTIICMAIIVLGTILSLKVSLYFVFLVLIGVPVVFLLCTAVVALVCIAGSLEKEEIRRRYAEKENKKDK